MLAVNQAALSQFIFPVTLYISLCPFWAFSVGYFIDQTTLWQVVQRSNGLSWQAVPSFVGLKAWKVLILVRFVSHCPVLHALIRTFPPLIRLLSLLVSTCCICHDFKEQTTKVTIRGFQWPSETSRYSSLHCIPLLYSFFSSVSGLNKTLLVLWSPSLPFKNNLFTVSDWGRGIWTATHEAPHETSIQVNKCPMRLGRRQGKLF